MFEPLFLFYVTQNHVPWSILIRKLHFAPADMYFFAWFTFAPDFWNTMICVHARTRVCMHVISNYIYYPNTFFSNYLLRKSNQWQNITVKLLFKNLLRGAHTYLQNSYLLISILNCSFFSITCNAQEQKIIIRNILS